MLCGMTMGRRLLTLGIGAALLVGGWGAARYAVEQQKAYAYYRSDVECQQTIYIGGFVGMAVGAGLMGFAMLQPTNHKDE